jgi:hypothetical protein
LSSTKRQRCNSGSDADSDGNSGRKVPKNGSQRRQANDEWQPEKKKEEKVEFSDSDEEKQREMEEGRVFGGPISSLGDSSGRRRRKDAITVPLPGLKTVSSEVNGSFTPIPFPQRDHTPTSPTPVLLPSCSSPQNFSISKALNRIPLKSWESSTPILDALIKETLRIAEPHTAMRRNLGPEFYIDGKLVETGDYVIYPFSDVHLDENVYEKAGVWLPERWLGSEDADTDPAKGVPFGYVGWGAGTQYLSLLVLSINSFLYNKQGKACASVPA